MIIKVNTEHNNELICEGKFSTIDKAMNFAKSLIYNGIEENKIYFEFEVEE